MNKSPIRHDSACQTESPPNPVMKASEVKSFSRSHNPHRTHHGDRHVGSPGGAGSTSRRKIAAGLMFLIVSSGQRAKSSVDNNPRATPFTNGDSADIDRAGENPS